MTAEFSMLLPRGWSRFDLSGNGEVELETQLGHFVRNAQPVHQPAARRLVDETVRPMLSELAQAGAVSVIASMAADPTQPMVVCTRIDITDQLTPVEWLAGLVAADATAELVDVPALLAVRTHDQRDATEEFLDAYSDFLGTTRSPQADPGSGLKVTSRRVTYMVGDPEDSDRWLSFTLGVQQPPGEAGRELADLSIDLFDAMMTSVRWAA